jgi:hypothetical protein
MRGAQERPPCLYRNFFSTVQVPSPNLDKVVMIFAEFRALEIADRNQQDSPAWVNPYPSIHHIQSSELRAQSSPLGACVFCPVFIAVYRSRALFPTIYSQFRMIKLSFLDGFHTSHLLLLKPRKESPLLLLLGRTHRLRLWPPRRHSSLLRRSARAQEIR